MDLANPQPTQTGKSHSRKIYIRVIVIAAWAVVGTLVYAVVPKLTSMYKEFGVPLPESLKYAPYIGFGLPLLLLIFSELVSESLSDRIPWTSIAFLLIGLIVGLLVVSVINPIYNLTGQFVK